MTAKTCKGLFILALGFLLVSCGGDDAGTGPCRRKRFPVRQLLTMAKDGKPQRVTVLGK